MEGPSPSVSNTPAASFDVMTPQPVRPEQGKFSKEETNFFKSHLPAYAALCQELGKQATGPRGTGLVRGRKKEWILSKVFPEFVKQFSSDQNDGPKRQSLQEKMLRWFANHSPNRSSCSSSTALTAVSSKAMSKRPRATNGASVFAEEHKAEIAEKMAEQQDQEGGTPKQDNLTRYRAIKQEFYNQLTDEVRSAYEAKAAERNKASNALPEKSKIFENQEDIVGGVGKALHNLVGWGWGQYGEAIFFVQGAYRNADGDLKTFNVSVTPNTNTKVTGFSLTLPDYKAVLRAPFRKWAQNALAVHSSPVEGGTDIADGQQCVIGLQEDGLPCLPDFDIDLIAPNDARLMLKVYIELTWKFTIKAACIQSLAVPWDLLDTASLRKKLLSNPEAFSDVKTMDPMRMSPHDIYSVLALLSKSQGSGVRLLEFSIGDIFESHTAGQETSRPSEPPTGPTGDKGIDNATAEISELSDSTSQPPSPARCTANSEPCTASPRDLAYEGIGPQSLDSLPPLLSAPATTVSPVIDRPSPLTPLLSQSMIKVAIKNVAELNIPEASAVDPLHQSLQLLKTTPQQDGKAKTSNSNSKKRKREVEFGPNEDKQRKKQAVPTREQSSRLKDAKYKNKHVTVRPR